MSPPLRNVAADELLAEHTPALRNFLGARCRDDDVTADLLQEVAARLVTAAPRLSLNGNARAYLFRVAANVWHDHLRKEMVVRRAVSELPAAQREVVELRHSGGLTFQQIADRLGRPLGTVLTQMRAALLRIGAALEDYR